MANVSQENVTEYITEYINEEDDDDTVPWCITFQGASIFFKCLYYTCMAVAAIGFCGSVMVFVVLHKKFGRSVTNFLLKLLAFLDGSYLLSNIVVVPMYMSSQLCLCDKSTAFKTTYRIVFGVMIAFQLASIWHLVVIGFFRFIAIYKPFLAKRICTFRTGYILIATYIFLIACVLSPYYYQMYRFRMLLLAHPTVIDNLAWTLYPEYEQFLVTGMYLVMPLTLLLVFNIGICIALWRRPASIKAVQDGNNEEAKGVTRTIIAIILVFVISYSGHILYVVDKLTGLHIRDDWYVRDKSCFVAVVYDSLRYLPQNVNSAANFIIYFFLRPSFRKCTKELFGCGKATKNLSKKQSGSSKSTMISKKTSTSA